MKNLNVDIITLEQFSAFVFPLIEGGPRVIDDGGYSSVDRSSNNTGGTDNNYDDRPDKDPKPDDVEKMNDAMNTNGDAATPNTETQEEGEEESVFDKIKDWVKEKYEEGKAKVAEERAQQKAEEAAMMEKLANRNQQNQQRLKDKAETLREEARNSSGAEAERLNNEADFWEERAETYENRSEALNGYKEKLGKKAEDLKGEAESIRGKREKEDININEDFNNTFNWAESIDTRVEAMDIGELLGRTYQYDSIYQAMEEAAPYEPQFDEAIPNTTLNSGQQPHQEITPDQMPPIEPLEPLDYHIPLETCEETIKMMPLEPLMPEPVNEMIADPQTVNIPGLHECAIDPNYASQALPPQENLGIYNDYYQLPTSPGIPKTGNFITDIANVPYNGTVRIYNSGLDFINEKIYDAQFIDEYGWPSFAIKTTYENVIKLKKVAASVNDLLTYGPNRAMGYLTDNNPMEIAADVYDFFKASLTNVENWERSYALGVETALLKRLGEPGAANNVGGVVDDFAVGLGPRKTAEELYNCIKRSNTDVLNISKHYNLKPERLQKIKEYVFDNPNYTPHQPTAEAWQRLSQGKGTEHNKLLLKHETVEIFYNDWIPNNPKKYSEKYEPLTSHDISNIKGYNWEEKIPIE